MISQLKFEFAYNNIAIQHIGHYAIGTPNQGEWKKRNIYTFNFLLILEIEIEIKFSNKKFEKPWHESREKV